MIYPHKPVIAVNTLHIVLKNLGDGEPMRNDLQSLSNQGGKWHEFRLMPRVKIKLIGWGMYIQVFDDGGNFNELVEEERPRVTRVGIWKGKSIPEVLGDMDFGQRADSEEVVYAA